jgi:hypothetical protein
MKFISIHQPAYLPWLGYFHRIILSDVFIFLDTVQFEKNSFTNRNKILVSGGPIWLTVPIKMKGHTSKVLHEMEISADERWKNKHLRSIELAYSKTSYFNRFFPDIERYILSAGSSFCDFVYSMTAYFLNVMGIDIHMVRSSSLPIRGVKSELVKNIGVYLNADIYISGALGRDYLDLESFARENIKVIYQDYRHPVYPQRLGGFKAGMSILDLLMNRGEKEARSIIMSGNLTRKDLEGCMYAS